MTDWISTAPASTLRVLGAAAGGRLDYVLWIALAVVVAGVVGKLIQFLLRRRGAAENEPLISLVLLLRRPRTLDKQAVSRVADRAVGVSRTTQLPDSAGVLPGIPPPFLVTAGGFTFGVLNVSSPYVEDVESAAEAIGDLRVRKAFGEHRAWLAVDLMGAEQDTDLDEAYRYIGKLVAGFAGEDCLAIFAPATGRMNVLDEDLLAKLRGPDPLEAVTELTHPPVIEIADDDPRMMAAVEQARARWPEFVEAFAKRRPGDHLAVKAPLTDGKNTEFIWVEVSEIDGDVIRGKLGNEPVYTRDLRMEDAVEVKLQDVSDWAYEDADGFHGGFTMEVLMEAQKRRR